MIEYPKIETIFERDTCGTLEEAINFVKEPRKTILRGDAPMEGLVCRPSVPILDKMGNRIIVKIKYCDFKEE